MPTAVMRSWLGVGTAFALLIMTAVLLVPSPDLSGGIDRSIAFLTNRDKDNSDLAIGKDGKEDAERPRGQQAQNKNDQPGAKDGKDGKQAGESGDGEKGTSDQSGDKSGGSKKGDSKKGNQSKRSDNKKSSPEKSKDESKQNSDSDPKEQKGSDQDKSSEFKKQNKKSGGNKNNQKQVDQKKKDPQQQQGRAEPAKRPDKNAAKKQNQPPPASNQTPPSPKLGWLARLISYSLAFVILAVLLWMFRDEIAKFWNELFGKKTNRPANETNDEAEPIEVGQPLPAFHSFREPFSSGEAAQWSASQTIDYTFAALEAWAREHQVPRDIDQTPFEFAADLAGLNVAVSTEAKQLAKLHGQSMFGGTGVSPDETSKLMKLWQLMMKNSADKPQ